MPVLIRSVGLRSPEEIKPVKSEPTITSGSKLIQLNWRVLLGLFSSNLTCFRVKIKIMPGLLLCSGASNKAFSVTYLR